MDKAYKAAREAQTKADMAAIQKEITDEQILKAQKKLNATVMLNGTNYANMTDEEWTANMPEHHLEGYVALLQKH